MRAETVLPAGAWDPARERDQVWIDFDRRHRRRIALETVGGHQVLLDLPQAVRLHHGDGLLLADGGVVRVSARPEPLLDIHAHDAAGLVRIAWHLGNRHLPVQLLGAHVRIRRDHVIADMVRQLGGHVREVEAPFDPEAGAYAGGHAHAHDDEAQDEHPRGHAHDGHPHAHGDEAHTHDARPHARDDHAHPHDEAPHGR